MLVASAMAHAQGPTATSLTATTSGAALTGTVPAQKIITLTATVTGAGAPVSPGKVLFCDAAPPHCTDIHLVGTAQLTSAGTATMRLVPGTGVHHYTAAFVGTRTNATSVSGAVQVTVGLASTPTIASGGGPGHYTLTSVVTGNGATAPTGTVNFLDTSNANYILASAPLVSAYDTNLAGFQYQSILKGVVPVNASNPGLAIGDFNNDGHPDILVGNMTNTSSAEVALGDGMGGFMPAKSYPPAPGSASTSFAVADFDSDGRLDMVMTQTSNVGGTIYAYTYVMLGNGDGTFNLGQTIYGYGTPNVAVGDFNGDGIPDLVLSAGGSIPDGVSIYLGKGDGTFPADASATYENGITNAPIVADLNGDGRDDLILWSSTEDSLTVMLVSSDGTFRSTTLPLGAPGLLFTPPPELLSPIPPEEPGVYPVTVADLNADGVMDIVATSYDKPTFVGTQTTLLGNGDGTYRLLSETLSEPIPILLTSPGQVPAEYSYTNIWGGPVAADVNNDGLVDLVIGGALRLGNGDGTFGQLLVGAPAIGLPADFNGDGLIDFVGLYGSAINVLQNLPDTYTATATVSGVGIVGTGDHFVLASYSGDANYTPGVSTAIPLQAEPEPTTLSLTASPTSLNEFQHETMTATVSPSSAQNHTPGGTMTFSAGNAPLGTAPVVNGTASFDTIFLPAGTDAVTATYSGDTNFAPSTSNTSTITVVPVDFTMSLLTPSITLESQFHTVTQIDFASINGFNDTLTLSCGTLPRYVTCAPSPTSVPLAANGTTSASLYIDTDLIQGFQTRNQPRNNGLPSRSTLPLQLAALLPAGLLANLLLRRKNARPLNRPRLPHALQLLLLTALTLLPTLTLTGCGEIILPPPSTAPGTYSIPITAIGSTTHLTHTIQLTLIITPYDGPLELPPGH